MNPNEEQALDYAVSIVARYAKTGEIYIPELDTKLRGLETIFAPVFQSRGLPNANNPVEQKLVGYHVAENDAKAIEKWLLRDVDSMEFIRKKIAFNIKNEFRMPPTLISLAVAILNGQFDFPNPPAKKRNNNHRDTLLVGVAKRVSQKYRITFNGNPLAFQRGNSVPILGSTIAAAALFGFENIVNPGRAHKICANNSSISNTLEPNTLSAGIESITNYLMLGDYILVEDFVSNEVLLKAQIKAREYWRNPI